MSISGVLTQFDDILYTWLLIYMLAGAGIYFSIRTGFVQIRKIKEALADYEKQKKLDKENDEKIE